jgi:hypothetical protein
MSPFSEWRFLLLDLVLQTLDRRTAATSRRKQDGDQSAPLKFRAAQSGLSDRSIRLDTP